MGFYYMIESIISGDAHCVRHLDSAMVIRASLVLPLVTFRGRTNGLTASATTRSLRLCAFRSRSRNTYGFEPLDSFDLPLQEFLASASASTAALATDEDRSSWIRLRRTRGSDLFRWIESPMGNSRLIEAASRCVLLHGLFEVWGHGGNKEEAAADAVRSRRFPQDCVDAPSWSVRVTSYGRSNLSKDERNDLVDGPVGEFLSTVLKGERQSTTSHDSEVRIRVIEDACPPPVGNVPQHVRKRPLEAVTGGEKWFYICRELQVGPAVGSGEDMGMTFRRPIRGILSTLALNRRRCRGATAIEPEIALVMANLAKVRPWSRVLDPFCGSSSLLLPAAFMGANTWGSDVAGPVTAVSCAETVESSLREGLEGIYEDFKALGLRPPTLATADVADQESSVRRSNFYDAFITDPPYSIKEAVVVKTAGRGVRNATLAEHAEARIDDPTQPGAEYDQRGLESSGGSEWEVGSGAAAIAHANNLVGEVIWSLISLARFSLKPGGRLCFFLPLRGEEARLDVLPTGVLKKLVEPNTFGERLVHVYSSKQIMKSPSMCRWLLVLEKELPQLGD